MAAPSIRGSRCTHHSGRGTDKQAALCLPHISLQMGCRLEGSPTLRVLFLPPSQLIFSGNTLKGVTFVVLNSFKLTMKTNLHCKSEWVMKSLICNPRENHCPATSWSHHLPEGFLFKLTNHQIRVSLFYCLNASHIKKKKI